MKSILLLMGILMSCTILHAQTTLTFDGVDDYTQTNYYNNLDLGTADFALEAMVSNLDFSLSDTLTILARQNTNSTQGIRWSITNSSILVQIENTLYTMSHTFSGCTHLAVVRDNGNLLFYANHVLLGTQPIGGTITTNCANCDLLMGKTIDDTNHFKGSLDEVRIWNAARSGINIESYETTCLDSAAMTNTSLVGYWNFEENGGQFVNNISNTANYARLGNSFYTDNNDPTWTTTSCISSTCYPTGLAAFTLSDNNPKEADLVTLTSTNANSTVLYWRINGNVTSSVNTLQYAFPLGMNIIQLVVTSASGLSIRTVLLDVTRPKYPCGADELLDWRRLNDPTSNYGRSLQVLNMIRGVNARAAQDSVYYIPVVFHIIANNQARLSSFDSTRIQTQLDTINAAFTKNNTNVVFCLAKNLPSGITQTQWSDFGTPTTPGLPGITYTLDTLDQLTKLNFASAALLSNLANQLPFKPEEYLSIYVSDSILLPDSTPVLGISAVGPNFQVSDGIGVQYEAFVGGTSGPLGKVAVHEVGHWLGLYHVFDDGIGGDGICDTYAQPIPTQDVVPAILNCDSAYSGTICPPGIPYNQGEDYMDYHLETCLDFFSPGQVEVMNRLLDIGRPFIHSEFNLINTGVQKVGGCLDRNIVTASFVSSATGICSGEILSVNGASVNYDFWEWNVYWDSTKNSNASMPTGTLIGITNDSGSMSLPSTDITISEPGVWDIYLTVTHLDTSTGDTIPITVMDTLSVTILDCSVSDERYRITTAFDSSDWRLSKVSLDVVTASLSDTTEGYIITGTSQKDSIEVGALMQVNLSGITQWRKTISSPLGDVRLFDIISNVSYNGLEDCYALTGHLSNGSTKNLLFIITDKQGNILFQENYPIENNGTVFPQTTGFHLVQLSSAFNNQFAVVGFTGDGVDSTDKKSGFIIGLDPSLGLGNSLVWNHFYESIGPNTLNDYDLVENVVEIVADFGSGPVAALVVGGNINRPIVSKSSGAFLSCLRISGQVVTEQWRKNIESAALNPGYSIMIDLSYGNDRLFGICYSELSHGSFLFEIDKVTGGLSKFAEIGDFGANEMLIDNGACVISGRVVSTTELMAIKVDLPILNTNTWNTASSAIIRTYSDTYIGPWNGAYTSEEGFSAKPKNIVVSPNGGYMLMSEISNNIPIALANGVSPIQVAMIKLDAVLVSACFGISNDLLRGIITQIDYPVINDSINLNINYDTTTTNCIANSSICFSPYCNNLDTVVSFYFQKCAQDALVLTSDLSAIGDYSYQWSPSTYLSNDTILEPITTTPSTQTYRLTITENSTGCQVSVAEYVVTVPDTISLTGTVITKCALDTIQLLNVGVPTGNFTYAWSPSSFLSDSTILEPMCSTTTSRVYTLVATGGNSGCETYSRSYVVNVILGSVLTEHRINCLSSDPAYFTTVNPPSSPSHYRMNLNIVLNNLGISDTTGVWNSPSPNSIVLSNPSFFDPVTNIILAGIAANLGTLYYTYGNGSCQNRLVLHFLPDASINGASQIDVCEEAVLTFDASVIDSTIEHGWNVYGKTFSGGGSSGLNILIQSIPFGDSLSFTGIFTYDSAYQYYIVEHRTRVKGCSDQTSSVRSVEVYVYPADGTIILDSCTGTLVLPTNTPSDTIQWYDATTGLAITGENTHSYSPPTGGSYYATVTTPQCDFISDTFNYTPLSPISSTATVSSNYNGADISCFGATDGAATVTVSNGLNPYIYLWSNGDTLATATNLIAGIYQVTVIDACSDTTISSVSLTEPSILSVNVDTTIHVSCAGFSDGSISTTTTGGTTPYTYLWSNSQTTSTVTGLTAGSYTITVTDDNGCSISVTVTVTEPNPLNTTLTNTNPISCAGQSDGTVTATTTGGTTPYTYTWSNGMSGSTINSLGVGTYIVTITDANNCTFIDSITLTVPPLPVITTSVNTVSCNGFADGAIATTITGVTGPYSYLWSNTQTGATATSLVAGVYSLTLTDNNGCTVTTTTTVTEPTILTSTLDSTNVDCVAPNSGAIDNTPTGGTLPYTYLWSNGATTEDLNSLVAGNYCVTITDANNCTFVTCTNVEPLITPLSIVKLVDKDTIVPYDTLCYSIVVTNNCQSSKDAVVSDTLATGLLVNTLGSFSYDMATNTLTDTITIAAGASDTLQFKVRVLKTSLCGTVDSITNQANVFELGTSSPMVSSAVTSWIQDSFATNCTPLPDTVYFSDLIATGTLLSSTSGQTINVTGVWILDAGTSYIFSNNSVLEMNPGAQIIVSPGASLTLNNTTVQAACSNCLWQSILVQSDGSITTSNNTILRDAQYAIHTENNATLRSVTNTSFLDNFIGIYVAPNMSNNNLIVGRFQNNLFSAPSILPPYVGLQGAQTLDENGTQTTVSPNATGGTGLAGIFGWDLLALNLNLGTPSLSNSFQRLVAGIVLFNSNFSTNSCSFNTITQNNIYASNLAYQGCGVHVQSPLLLDFKEAKVEDCSFVQCFIGISGISSGMRIYRNQMTEIFDMGVRSTRLFNTIVHVQNNTFSKMERLGVAAFDPRIPSDIWIDNNTINMTTLPGVGSGILISDNSTTLDASSLVISNNTIDANEAENGIAVLFHENSSDPKFAGLIQRNNITMKKNSKDRAGISIFSSRLNVECNTITGDGQTLGANNTYGIVAAGGALGGTSTYQCNTVTNTNRGVFFEGFNNEITFRGNGFDRHDIGLLMDANSIIGDQFDNQEYYGNTWTGGANSDVFHNGNGFIQTLSRFRVNPSFNPNFEPQNAGAFPAWFNSNNNFPNFNCVEPFNYCGNSRSSNRSNTTNSRNNSTNNPRITGLDNALARNGLGNIPLVTKYNAKRALFRKLVNNPSLVNNNQNPHIQNFVASHQNTCIGHFDNIATQCEQAFMVSTLDSILLDSCKNICSIYLDSLHSLDSILAINFNSRIATNRNAVANSLNRFMQQQQMLLGNIQAQQQIVLTPICANNNSFNTVILHEVLEREVNDLYLNTLAKGILEFSNSELISLRKIAAHCPQEGGAAVHQARGMLSMVEDVDLLNFDCTTNNGRSSIIEEGNESKETNSIEKWDLILYPNPTNNTITLESNLVLEDEIQIEIYNALGQKVKEVTINEDIKTIDINVSSFLDGIYNIRLQSGNYKITKAFVVVK